MSFNAEVAENAEEFLQREPKTRDQLNKVSGTIIELGIKVHKTLGPGMLENAYNICLVHELVKAGLRVRSQVKLPVVYDGIKLDAGYRLDLLVEECVIVELKTVDRIMPVHEAQLLSYLRMSGIRLGLLINFNVRRLADGVRRVVNNF